MDSPRFLNGIIVPAGSHTGWVVSNYQQEESNMNATTESQACEPLCHLAKNPVHFLFGEGSQGLRADIACCTHGQRERGC